MFTLLASNFLSINYLLHLFINYKILASLLIMTTYYFAIASQDFLLHEEPVEEVLRERIDHYQNIQKIIDFWLVMNPSFVNAPEMTKIKKQLTKPSAAIISENKIFINWLKLRLGFVIVGEFRSPSENILNHLESDQI